jgi:hypothetical protein
MYLEKEVKNMVAIITGMVYIGAAFRHLSAFNQGENADPETGRSHVAHLACCAFMLLDYIKEHPELDDRYKPNV